MADPSSTRTAIPLNENPKTVKGESEKNSSMKTAVPPDQPKPSTGIKDVINIFWDALIYMLMIIVRFLHSAFEILSDVFIKIYRILLFCYRKPHHAKELFFSTIHIIKVSYDAEIWTWSDMWQVLKSHLIAPMTKPVPMQSPQAKQKQK
uniref:Protein TAPT1 homolog n=2 Tax=Caenorhabditis tropicalis TaxID=1561998 RepID=A0A1I7UBR3_9PELO